MLNEWLGANIIDMNRCVHFERCSGCSLDLRKESYDENSLFFAQAFAFFKACGMEDFKIHSGAFIGFRTRAKLAIRGDVGRIQIGMFEGRSHQILEIPYCQVQHPRINQAVSILQSWLNEQGFSAYQETTGQGLFRYVQLTISEQEKIQLALALNCEDPIEAKLGLALQRFWAQHENLFHSIWLNFNVRRDNVIFGEAWTLFSGETWMWQTFLSRAVAFHPASFMQANPAMFEQLLQRLQGFIPEESIIAEFYAGGGTIGLTLLDRAKRIDFNEIDSVAHACFQASCSILPEDSRSKLSFVVGKAGSSDILNQHDVELVIVDPPRKGLDKKLLDNIIDADSVKQLIYISCGFESFKRDANHLLKAGFSLKSAEAFLFFPGTDHLEILAVFGRNAP